MVIATDLSERAPRYAGLSAALSDVVIDSRDGDLYEPVEREEPFDIIITANLSHVVGPDTAFTFRDGGRARDDINRAGVIGASVSIGGTVVAPRKRTVPPRPPKFSSAS